MTNDEALAIARAASRLVENPVAFGDFIDWVEKTYQELKARDEANAALGVAARSQLAGNVPQQDTAPATG
jgi:hypothetical protein